MADYRAARAVPSQGPETRLSPCWAVSELCKLGIVKIEASSGTDAEAEHRDEAYFASRDRLRGVRYQATQDDDEVLGRLA